MRIRFVSVTAQRAWNARSNNFRASALRLLCRAADDLCRHSGCLHTSFRRSCHANMCARSPKYASSVSVYRFINPFFGEFEGIFLREEISPHENHKTFSNNLDETKYLLQLSQFLSLIKRQVALKIGEISLTRRNYYCKIKMARKRSTVLRKD